MTRGRKVLQVLLLLSSLTASVASAQQMFVPTGARTVFNALDPIMRKWWVPQELYWQFKWQPWEYSNYAKEHYERYVPIELRGERWYDIYGNYITRGWDIYEWSQEQGVAFGSGVIKRKEYSSWFNNVVIGHDSRGQYHLAVTIGDEIRTTLTPLTFSKPGFNGIQVDFLSDKYGLTALGSRVNSPGAGGITDVAETGYMDFDNLFGLRGTFQVGDLFKIGATYVNVHLGRTEANYSLQHSLKGNLTTNQNADVIRTITIRISDNSPEDGEYGAAFFSEQIWTRRRDPEENIIKPWGPEEIRPLREGGFPKDGYWTADGTEVIKLTYQISYPHQVDRIGFRLVLANDYCVEVTSDRQTNAGRQQVFLPVTKAAGNVHDNSNQKEVWFEYGLPTGREIYGLTFEAEDLLGFNILAEYAISRMHRRYPNINFVEHPLSTTKGKAFYLTVRKFVFPWFGYGEVFRIDDNYRTDMFLIGVDKTIDYENKVRNLYELVDDNDDQDRYADWKRANVKDDINGVFPGLDENNDLVSDFNQNRNRRPDYDEPFLRYSVDPPEFLFGVDMNHNTVIDRFEDDDLPDYPFRADHRGFNFYVGAEIVAGIEFKVGHSREWLWSDDRHSRDTYALFTLDRDYPRLGRIQFFNNLRLVKDDLPDDCLLWRDVPGRITGVIEKFKDPLAAQKALMNTAFLGFDYTQVPRLNVSNKIKYETYTQRGDNISRITVGVKPDTLADSRFLGVINKVDYTFEFGKGLTIQPKAKSMYRRRTPFQKGQLKWDPELNDLTEMLFLMLKFPAMRHSWIQLGAEYTIFLDRLSERQFLHPFRLSSDEEYTGTVFAAQLSIAGDYMGYLLTVNIGGEAERKNFERWTTTSTTTFITVFAGIRE